jgi:hypothetical protein
MYNKIMTFKKIISHQGFVILTWFVFIFFMVVILPSVSMQASLMGLTPSIDTNFSFNPNVIYSILDGYGESGRQFYLLQRWTFDFVWPMVYGFPIFLTFRLWLGKINSRLVTLLIYLPLMAMMLDYAENITFSLIILLYPMEWIILAYLGVVMSLLKWIALGVSLLSVACLSVVVLFQTIKRSLKSR